MSKSAIKQYGAHAVYQAACAKLQGDRAPLAAMGIDAATIGDANAIMTAAYHQMSEADRAADYWSASQKMRSCKRGD